MAYELKTFIAQTKGTDGKALVLAGATVTAVNPDTGASVPMYSDVDGTPLSPAVTDAEGFIAIACPDGKVRLTFSVGGASGTVTRQVVVSYGNAASIKASVRQQLLSGFHDGGDWYANMSTSEDWAYTDPTGLLYIAKQTGVVSSDPPASNPSQFYPLNNCVDGPGSALPTSPAIILKRNVHASNYSSVDNAIAALSSSGGRIFFEATTYPPISSPMTKSNVIFKGAGRPAPKSDNTGFVDGSGTIIKGPFPFYASGLSFSDLGIDSGSAVCSALYGGTAQEGLVSKQANPASSLTVYTGLKVKRVGAICQSASAAVHALAFEAQDLAQIDDTLGIFGLYGAAFKLTRSQVGKHTGLGNGSAAAIIKAQPSAPCHSSSFGQLVCGSIGSFDGGGVMFDAQYGTPLSGIAIGAIIAKATKFGLNVLTADYTSGGTTAQTTISDLTIGRIVAADCQNDGVSLQGGTGRVQRLSIDELVAIRNGNFGFQDSVNSKDVRVKGNCSNNSSGFVAFGQLTHILDGSVASGNTNYGYYAKSGALAFLGAVSGDSNGIKLVGNDSGAQFFSALKPTSVTAATLASSISNYGSGYGAASYQRDTLGRVTLNGAVAPSTYTAGSSLTLFALPAGNRPAPGQIACDMAFAAAALVSGNWTTVPVIVRSNGNVDAILPSGCTFVSMSGISFDSN